MRPRMVGARQRRTPSTMTKRRECSHLHHFSSLWEGSMRYDVEIAFTLNTLLMLASMWAKKRKIGVANHRHLPGRFAILKAQGQRFATLEHFACQNQVRSVLFDLGARHLNLFVRFERNAHLVEKFLGAKKDLD